MSSRSNFFLIALLSFSIQACGELADELSNVDVDTNTDVDNPTVGEVDDSAGFYVRVFETTDYSYFIHESSDFTEGCVVEEAEDATPIGDKDLDCYVEAKEGDLWYHGITFQYNVPSDMCNYFRFTPYYYYNWMPGTGASTIQYYIGADLSIGDDANLDGVIDGEVQVDGADDSTVEYSTLDGITPECAYNYSDNLGPNCCEGSYTVTTRTWDEDAGAYGDPVASDGEWGGNDTNCYYGPATETQSRTLSGHILSDIQLVQGSGTNDTYEVSSSSSLDIYNNYWASNYTIPNDANFTNNGSGGNDRTDLVEDDLIPAAFHPALDVKSGTDWGATSRYYRFECLDTAFETLAKIDVEIREWNTEDAYELMTTSGNPDLTGVEADFAADNFLLNDWSDWSDLGASGFNYPGGGLH